MFISRKKELILITILILALLPLYKVSSDQSKKFDLDDIYGTWQEDNSEYQIKIEFQKNNDCSIYYVDKIKNLSTTFKGEYKLDSKKETTTLSIRKINYLDFPIYSIVKLTNKNEMEIAKFSYKWRIRPIAFKDNSFKLKKHSDG